MRIGPKVPLFSDWNIDVNTRRKADRGEVIKIEEIIQGIQTVKAESQWILEFNAQRPLAILVN